MRNKPGTYPSPERVRELLDYDPESGRLIWKVGTGRCVRGSEAGAIGKNGYRVIGIDGTCFLSHRLVWLHVYGSLPETDIDHIDRSRSNNRLTNLREASRAQNNGNSGLMRTNTSGKRGVSFERSRNKWAAYIWRGNRKYHLGYFSSCDDAGRAYDHAAAEYFGDFASLNFKVAA